MDRKRVFIQYEANDQFIDQETRDRISGDHSSTGDSFTEHSRLKLLDAALAVKLYVESNKVR
jgi:hypothetical protein